MKTINKIAAITLMQLHLTAAGDQPSPDIFGYYIPLDGVSANATAIDHLQLSSEIMDTTIQVKGQIRFTSANGTSKPDIKLNGIMEGTKIKLKSKTFKEVFYTFNGTLSKLGNFPVDQPTDTVLLKGELERHQSKKVIKSGEIHFRYEPGD